MCMCVNKGKDYGDMNLDELNNVEDELDDEDERMFEAYRCPFQLITCLHAVCGTALNLQWWCLNV